MHTCLQERPKPLTTLAILLLSFRECLIMRSITQFIFDFFNAHMAKMTKSQMVKMLAEKTGHSKKDVDAMLETLISMAYKQVKTAGEFVLPGFGKLVKVKRKARTGRNPATGETIQIPAKTVVKFRVAKAAKDAVL
jgi:DNA-binding protein HU-beta